MNSTTAAAASNSETPNIGDEKHHHHQHRVQKEYNNIPDHGWERFFQEIRDKCEREADERNYVTNESSKPHNRSLNRYRDVNPYDHSRIVIHRGSVDYINANLVELKRADRKYILTQGPLSDTVGHFWLMVWEQKAQAILMLNKLMEKSQIKCHRYWPCKTGPEHAIVLDEVRLKVEYIRCEEYKNYIRRWFKLTDLETQQSREIIQFHYTTWPDFGIPSSPVAFLQFLKQVRDSGALDTNVGPAVVHCSAGIGRSGTFCLVDCCLILIEKEGEDAVSVQDILYELRRYRMGLIQTADQLYFSYKAIIEGIKLLKDPEFLNYQETPSTNCIEDQMPDPYSMDETPPPLPPRTHSLQLPGGVGGQQQQQQAILSTDKLNNYITAHTISLFENNSMTNRPLPPLPSAMCAYRQHHQRNTSNDLDDNSDSDENSFYEEIDDDDDDDDNLDVDVDDSDDENNIIGEYIDQQFLGNIDNDLALDINLINAPTAIADASNKNNKQQQQQQQTKTTAKRNEIDADDDYANANNYNKNSENHEQQNEAINKKVGGSGVGAGEAGNKNKSNGIVGLVDSGGGAGADADANIKRTLSPENELKRRKRTEREANIEQKINEIKRKKKELDESRNAAKNRKLLCAYIAAGVLVGLICVYAYTKIN